jgi:hypothetical protein
LRARLEPPEAEHLSDIATTLSITTFSIMTLSITTLSITTLGITRSKIQHSVYDNEYASIIHIYFYEYFIDLKLLVLALQNILDTLSDVLDKCLRFSLIKIESVSIFQAKPRLVPSSQSVIYAFLFKMLSLVLIKN